MKNKLMLSIFLIIIVLAGYKIFAEQISTGCYRYPEPLSEVSKKDKGLWDKKETNATEDDIRFGLKPRELYELGCVALEKGNGPRAVRFFETAAQKGYGDQSYKALATMYRQGIGVPKNLDKAEQYFNKIDSQLRRWN